MHLCGYREHLRTEAGLHQEVISTPSKAANHAGNEANTSDSPSKQSDYPSFLADDQSYLRAAIFDDTRRSMRPPSRILTAARIILGQTQTEVAERSGMSSRTLYLIENRAATIGSVEKLMKYYARCGVVFIQPDDKLGWGIRTNFLVGTYDDERPE